MTIGVSRLSLKTKRATSVTPSEIDRAKLRNAATQDRDFGRSMANLMVPDPDIVGRRVELRVREATLGSDR